MNFLSDIKKRYDFATEDDEQNYQRELHSSRRFANQTVSYFVRAKENAIFRGTSMKGFDTEAAWRFVDKWFFGAFMGQVTRSMTSGYDQHQRWKAIQDSAGLLASLADEAAKYDPQGSYSSELKATYNAPLYRLANDGFDAAKVMRDFARGDQPLNPSDAHATTEYLQGLAELHSQKAALQTGNLPAATAGATKNTDFHNIQKFAFYGSALLDHAAVPISSEDYIPQNKHYLSVEQAETIAAAVQAAAKAQGVQLLRNDDVTKPAQAVQGDAPVMLAKKTASGYRQLTQQEVVALYKAAHVAMEKTTPKLAALHAFRTEQDAAIKKKIIQPSQAEVAAFAASVANVDFVPAPQRNLFDAVGAKVETLKEYLTRPQIFHETWKIYNRAVSNQILALPVNFFEETLRYTVSATLGGDTSRHTTGRDTSGTKGLLRWMQDGQLDQGSRDFMKRNFKANMFRFFAQPVAGGHGETFAKESFYAFSKGAAVYESVRAENTLKHVMGQAHQHAPMLGKGLRELGRERPLETLLASEQYKDIPELLKKPESQTSPEDHQKLAKFYQDLANTNMSVAEEVMSAMVFGQQSASHVRGMDDILTHVLTKPITTVEQAMAMFSLSYALLQASREQNALVEYVQPAEQIMTPKNAERISRYVSHAAANLNTHDPNALIQFANQLSGQLNNCIAHEKLVAISRGQFKKDIIDSVEHALFKQTTDTVDEKPNTQITIPAQLTQKWQGVAKRSKQSFQDAVQQRVVNEEGLKEVKRLDGRLQGEKWAGTASTLVQAKLRHQNSLFDVGNLAYTAWTVLAYPIIYSKGLVTVRETWDELLFKKQRHASEAKTSESTISRVISLAHTLHPDMEQRLTEQTSLNSALMKLSKNKDYKDITEITRKPISQQTDADKALMSNFFEQVGDAVLEQNAHVMRSAFGEDNMQGGSIQSQMAALMNKPATTLEQAVLKLGAVQSILETNRGYMNVLRYLDTSDKQLTDGQIGEVSSFINDQAALAGLAGGNHQAADESTIIRFANVATEALAKTLGGKIQSNDSLSQKYLRKVAEKTTQQDAALR